MSVAFLLFLAFGEEGVVRISLVALMVITIVQARDVKAGMKSAVKTIHHVPYYQTGPGTAIGTDHD